MAVIVSDSFDRAGPVLGSTDSAYGGTSKAWQSLQGTFQINNNHLWNSITGQSMAVVDVGQSDVAASVTVTATSGSAQNSIILRGTDANNFFTLFSEPSTNSVKLHKTQAGTRTQLATATTTLTVPYTLKASLSGNTFTCYLNGSQVFTATETFNQTAKQFGVINWSGQPSFDDFLVEDIATGGTGTPGSALLQAVGTLTASGTVSISGGATLSGSGSLTATGIPKIPGAAQLSGTGSLTATGSATLPGNISGGAALTAAGSLTASGLVVIRGGATLQGTTTLTAAGKKTLRLNPYVGGERTLRLQDMLNIVAMKYPHAYDNEDIVSLINDAQARLFRTNYRVNTATTFDLYADNAFYPITFTPENIIDVVVDGKEYPYQNIKYDAQPYYYYVTNGNAIGLYPTPVKDVISGMTVLHYKEPAELSAGNLGAIPEFDGAWHMIIVYYVCRHLAEIARDTDMVNNFTLEINDIENEYKRSKRAKPHKVQDVYGVGRA